MEYNYPKFTPEMKKTHTILIPNMAITQFRLLEYALRFDGYKCEILGNCGSAVAQLGLKYVHNDTCYPALLVIGQFLDALNSGKYDLEHTALLITQTGGGCRASNYIHLLRKALVKAGYPQIPVASLNFSGLEKDSGFQMTLPLARRAIACIFYGDLLCALRNQVAPYENVKGSADRMVDLWVERLGRVLLAGKGYTSKEMKHTFPLIAKEFATIPVTRVPKVKVGVVGEIYVKYSPLGNNDLQKFLESQDCEVNFPGLMGFVQYCIFNMGEDHVLYGGKLAVKVGTDQLLNWLDSVERRIFKKVSQTVMFLPYFISWVVVSTVMLNIFGDNGVLNNVLASIGGEPYSIYSHVKTWPVVMVCVRLWKQTGYGTVVYLAAIAGISTEMYEAAEIDGADVWKKITCITIPSLKPTIFIMALLAIGNIFRGDFGMFYQLVKNNQLLLETSDVIDTFVYRTMITTNDYGMSAAAGLYQSVLCFITICTANFIVKKIDPDYTLF